MTDIQKKLFALQDQKYKVFNSRLVPNVDIKRQIGVRAPDIKQLAKKIKETDEAREFMMSLPHEYFEENNLHGYLLDTIKNFDECLLETEKFLPYIDNWATCDIISPSAFKKNLNVLEEKINEWIKSDSTYTVRFAMSMMMKHFLDEKFDKKHLALVANIKRDEYYINMMRAWYFATAMAKQRDASLPYFEHKKLDKWTHNKAIQKCVESFRISKDDKEILKALKVK